MKRHYKDPDAKLFDRAAEVLIRFLREEELVRLMDLIEEGQENRLFDPLNEHLVKVRPDLFASSDDPCKEVGEP
jgi:hypothetical protein